MHPLVSFVRAFIVRQRSGFIAISKLGLMTVLAAGPAHAGTETIIHSFERGKNGRNPTGGLINAEVTF
jgi:hypothetical protein